MPAMRAIASQCLEGSVFLPWIHDEYGSLTLSPERIRDFATVVSAGKICFHAGWKLCLSNYARFQTRPLPWSEFSS